MNVKLIRGLTRIHIDTNMHAQARMHVRKRTPYNTYAKVYI